jgi:hypothetical protein
LLRQHGFHLSFLMPANSDARQRWRNNNSVNSSVPVNCGWNPLPHLRQLT